MYYRFLLRNCRLHLTEMRIRVRQICLGGRHCPLHGIHGGFKRIGQGEVRGGLCSTRYDCRSGGGVGGGGRR